MKTPALKYLDESIYDLLEAVRKRPAVCIDEPSISRLNLFLASYTAGLGRVGFALKDQTDFHRFHDWIARRLGYGNSTSGWANMIRDKSASEADAFGQFFVYLDEFRKESSVAKRE